jgi:demethylmenaquinone methyltransferase/2-methoxy-6-polyprenyl-1,4-benzoquinol methylase
MVETSQPKGRAMRWAFHSYFRFFVFRIGHLLSGSRGAYRYLTESAVGFYTDEQLAEVLARSGFTSVETRPMFLGWVATHVATR